MSDPQDWVHTGVTPTIDPGDARKAARVVARTAIRRRWVSSDVREVLNALGLTEPLDGVLPGGGLFACPSVQARTSHIRRGVDCRVCWPGGRQPGADTGDSTAESAKMALPDSRSNGHPAASHPNSQQREA